MTVQRPSTVIDLQDHRQQVDQLQVSMKAQQAELGQRLLALEQENLDLQQQLVQAKQGRDHKLRQLQDQHGQELTRRQSVSRSSRQEVTEARRDLRAAERLAGELTADLNSCRRQLDAAELENSRLQGELNKSLEVYRSQQQRHAETLADPSGATGGGGEELLQYLEVTMQELKSSYAKREQDLLLHCRRQTERHSQARIRLVELWEAFRAARKRLEDGGMPVPQVAEGFTNDDVANIWQEDEQPPAAPVAADTGPAAVTPSEVPRLQAELKMAQAEVSRLRRAASAQPPAVVATKGVAEHLAKDQWAQLRAMVQQHLVKSQAALEHERGKLLKRCTHAEEVSMRLPFTADALSSTQDVVCHDRCLASADRTRHCSRQSLHVPSPLCRN